MIKVQKISKLNHKYGHHIALWNIRYS